MILDLPTASDNLAAWDHDARSTCAYSALRDMRTARFACITFFGFLRLRSRGTCDFCVSLVTFADTRLRACQNSDKFGSLGPRRAIALRVNISMGRTTNCEVGLHFRLWLSPFFDLRRTCDFRSSLVLWDTDMGLADSIQSFGDLSSPCAIDLRVILLLGRTTCF
ncbi:hypothetical protein BDY21DRAFT_126709 [Lineolata rhizophorae]|uniref:Uncharacterized protein n=1 Tax=Lineolata rhizophorae TaxID=578093 RepID=A0A6A6NPQ3_9PEZI|nr:hypothetical protein BDY21DRAFT_126709 [Lineolata rhizophorae]